MELVSVNPQKNEEVKGTDPAKKAATAKVAYKVEFALALVVLLICPPAPRPLRALKRPGHMKQTKPRRTTCVRG